jgi:DNA-binding phage protein
MPLTIDFRETIRERVQRDAVFQRGFLQEAIELMLSGDVKTGQKIIRNYINATVGFRDLAEQIHIPEKSLMRMFGPKGNPSSQNLFGVIAKQAKTEGVQFQLKAKPTLV